MGFSDFSVDEVIFFDFDSEYYNECMDRSSPFPARVARQLSTARGGPRVFLSDGY
jgi:hypothetical protein